MNTTQLFTHLLNSRRRWLDAGLKEFDRKYYLRLKKLGTMPHWTVQEKRLAEAGYVKLTDAEIVPAEWEGSK